MNYEAKVIVRFRSKYVKVQTGCWLWVAGGRSDGYGMFYIRARRQNDYAHRVSYEMNVGPIPEGLTLDHLCRERRCVNPEHLEPVTYRTNTLRGIGPSAINAKRTHCPRGHEYTSGNTYMRVGKRHCRECGRANSRRWHAKKKATAATARPAIDRRPA